MSVRLNADQNPGVSHHQPLTPKKTAELRTIALREGKPPTTILSCICFVLMWQDHGAMQFRGQTNSY